MSGSSVLHTNTGSMKKHFWLLALILVAFFVRVFGIIHDLPFTYFGDEEHFINRSVAFGSGDLNPHWFHKPAFYMYTLFFEYGVYFCAGYALGFWRSTDEFAVSFVQNPGPFYLIGRLTTVAFSLATIIGVYRIGERHIGKEVGLVAAAFLALTYGHVEASRVIKADVPSACFCIWSMYFLLNYLQDGTKRNLALSSALAGVGAATKFYGLVMLLPIFFEHSTCSMPA